MTRSKGSAAENEPWVSVEHVAAHIGVRKDTVYRWIEHRGLPAQKVGKLWKAKLSEVDAWMHAGGTQADGSAGASARAAVTAVDASAGARSPAHSVLVVDDDESIRETLGYVASEQGYKAIAAADGAEALRLLRSPGSPKPSLILLDLHMPNMDGLEFLEEQKRDPELSGIPVVIITAETRPTVGGAPVVHKPLDLARLIEAIRGALG